MESLSPLAPITGQGHIMYQGVSQKYARGSTEAFFLLRHANMSMPAAAAYAQDTMSWIARPRRARVHVLSLLQTHPPSNSIKLCILIITIVSLCSIPILPPAQGTCIIIFYTNHNYNLANYLVLSKATTHWPTTRGHICRSIVIHRLII